MERHALCFIRGSASMEDFSEGKGCIRDQFLYCFCVVFRMLLNRAYAIVAETYIVNIFSIESEDGLNLISFPKIFHR